MNRNKLKKYLYWDIDTFGIGLDYILRHIPGGKGLKALDLGANYGGVSVCLVTEKNYSVVCSDLDNPQQKVLSAHPEINGNPSITFDAVNGLDIKYPDNSFDLVIFKSVLGFIDDKEKQQHFINEIYRVLKPGGQFCFLENSMASALHRFARKHFVSWGNNWRYVTFDEMKEYTSPFKTVDIKACGYFTAFAKANAMRYPLFILDKLILPFLPSSYKYVIYGIATK